MSYKERNGFYGSTHTILYKITIGLCSLHDTNTKAAKLNAIDLSALKLKTRFLHPGLAFQIDKPDMVDLAP